MYLHDYGLWVFVNHLYSECMLLVCIISELYRMHKHKRTEKSYTLHLHAITAKEDERANPEGAVAIHQKPELLPIAPPTYGKTTCQDSQLVNEGSSD